jgi:flagellar motility protein MotE (MotC chaperone)
MVRFILILFIFNFQLAHSQFLGFGDKKTITKSRIPSLIEKLKIQEVSTSPQYEDAFEQNVKNLETAIEEEKLYCAGEAADENGKFLASNKKQLCMRELKQRYLDSLSVIFELKKKYLEKIHEKHLEKMGDIYSKMKAGIESNF